MAAQNGQVPAVATTSSPEPQDTEEPPPPTSSDFGQYPDSYGGFSSGYFPLVETSGTGTTSPAPAKHVAVRPLEPKAIPLSFVVGVDLWTRSSIIVLILLLALVGVLSAPRRPCSWGAAAGDGDRRYDRVVGGARSGTTRGGGAAAPGAAQRAPDARCRRGGAGPGHGGQRGRRLPRRVRLRV